MKRWLAILTALLCLLLVACGDNLDNSNTTAPTGSTAATEEDDQPQDPPSNYVEPSSPANVGDVLETPDVAATFEEITDYEIFRVEVQDIYDFHYIYAWEYSFATDTTVMYIYDEYQNEEIVNVVKRDVVTRYSRLIGEETFLLNTNTDEFTWLDDEQIFSGIVDALTQYSLPIEGLQYKKLEDVEATAGDACAYEVLEDGTLSGYIYIDKATGVMSAWLDETQKVTSFITAISTEDAGIPKYK